MGKLALFRVCARSWGAREDIKIEARPCSALRRGHSAGGACSFQEDVSWTHSSALVCALFILMKQQLRYSLKCSRYTAIDWRPWKPPFLIQVVKVLTGGDEEGEEGN